MVQAQGQDHLIQHLNLSVALHLPSRQAGNAVDGIDSSNQQSKYFEFTLHAVSLDVKSISYSLQIRYRVGDNLVVADDY